MNDMSAVIIPKSDQINADDLIGGPITIRIAGVDIRPGTEQPVSIHYEGENGRPWKPCKSMSRVLVAAWGPDAKQYVGRTVTLYRDPTVKWGGMEVGGIRVSHLSHIQRDMVLALTATKGSRKPFTVKPLATPAGSDPIAALPEKARASVTAMLAELAAVEDAAGLMALVDRAKAGRDMLRQKFAAASAEVERRFADAYQRHMEPAPVDPLAAFDDADRGEVGEAAP